MAFIIILSFVVAASYMLLLYGDNKNRQSRRQTSDGSDGGIDTELDHKFTENIKRMFERWKNYVDEKQQELNRTDAEMGGEMGGEMADINQM